jgi:hypothetical protein
LLIGFLFGVGFSDSGQCEGSIVAYLTEAQVVSPERFETDLMLFGSADRIGDEIELINLDIVKSTIRSQPLTDFERVWFDAAPPFAPWQSDQQFGMTPGFESIIVLDAFASGGAIPYPLTDTNPFRVGTLTFDFSGLGLQVGDSITLNIAGQDDDSQTRTTSIAIRPSGSSMTILLNPEFPTNGETERSTFTLVTAVPEPGVACLLTFAIVSMLMRRRNRKRSPSPSKRAISYAGNHGPIENCDRDSCLVADPVAVSRCNEVQHQRLLNLIGSRGSR